MNISNFLIILLNFILMGNCFSKDDFSVVIIGDSITDGYGVAVEKSYPSLLQNKISKEFKDIKIIASAISGSVTASAHSRLQWIKNNEKNLLGVVVALGGNDLLRGIKPVTMEKNYMKLLDVAQKRNIPILLATIPVPQNYGAYQKDLDELYSKLSKNPNVTILSDFLKGVVSVSSMNQTDGIHPNEVGHALIANNIYGALKKWIAKIRKENVASRSK